MSVRVRIPVPLRRLVGGAREVEVSNGTVRRAIKELDGRYPGFGGRILDEEGNLHRFINLYVNGEDIRFRAGLATELRDGDELSIVPAIAGG